MPYSIFRKGGASLPRWCRWRRLPWRLVVIVIVVAAVAPWLNPQVVAVLCAVLASTLPLLVMRYRPAMPY